MYIDFKDKYFYIGISKDLYNVKGFTYPRKLFFDGYFIEFVSRSFLRIYIKDFSAKINFLYSGDLIDYEVYYFNCFQYFNYFEFILPSSSDEFIFDSSFNPDLETNFLPYSELVYSDTSIGKALYFYDDFYFDINSSDFLNNSNYSFGGYFYFTDTDYVISNSDFENKKSVLIVYEDSIYYGNGRFNQPNGSASTFNNFNQWIHIVVVFSNNISRVYRNGVEIISFEGQPTFSEVYNGTSDYDAVLRVGSPSRKRSRYNNNPLCRSFFVSYSSPFTLFSSSYTFSINHSFDNFNGFSYSLSQDFIDSIKALESYSFSDNSISLDSINFPTSNHSQFRVGQKVKLDGYDDIFTINNIFQSFLDTSYSINYRINICHILSSNKSIYTIEKNLKAYNELLY